MHVVVHVMYHKLMRANNYCQMHNMDVYYVHDAT